MSVLKLCFGLLLSLALPTAGFAQGGATSDQDEVIGQYARSKADSPKKQLISKPRWRRPAVTR